MPSCDPPNMRGAEIRNSPVSLISAMLSSGMRRLMSTSAARARSRITSSLAAATASAAPVYEGALVEGKPLPCSMASIRSANLLFANKL